MIGYSNSPCIWSDMSSEQQQMTINMYPNNGSIMRFYNGNFILGDNEVTFRLLDTLVSKQDCCYKGHWRYIYSIKFVSIPTEL